MMCYPVLTTYLKNEYLNEQTTRKRKGCKRTTRKRKMCKRTNRKK